ncbi:MAG: hypothetical protein UY04_C0001G0046 [Parcubacteria group bacterium GW2011_GWA2_47_7]|nr:MAG: hypothetical protein UY04_C0001G0046 [Parcubacteria group bacterium GW2011_GWA2_47_7]
MAFESHYFKRDIRKEITSIRKLLDTSLSPLTDTRLDEVFSKVEIKLFMISFSTRKLIETKKLPDSVLDMEIGITRFPRNAKRRGAFFDFEKLYSLDKPTRVKMRLRDILNQFMHSFVFQATANTRRKLTNVFVCSDRAHTQYLYLVNIKSFLKFILRATEQQVTQIHVSYDNEKGRFVMVVR